MYMDFTVRIPDTESGISKKKIKGSTYVYYVYAHQYDPNKKYTVPKSTSIGRCHEEDPTLMYPNSNFTRFFPEADLSAEENDTKRSACLRIGAFLVIQQVITEYRLDEMLERIIGLGSGLFLDLATYAIITENNAGQYYPDYAYNHPLFTRGMRVYSDSKVSEFINKITRDNSLDFQAEWNALRDHNEKIYISYDSTNKNCQAGDIDFVEMGHPKNDDGKPVINYSVAYDRNNSEPLYYEAYPGSIVDVSQLQSTLTRTKGYGYKQIGFILDRGYFSEENIHYMDSCGFEFVIMMKGLKPLVKNLVEEVKGSFEEKREYSIRGFKVNGITVTRKLYPSDVKKRYFHIYYSDRKKTIEREHIESRIDCLAEYLKNHEHTKLELDKCYSKYFDLTYINKGKSNEKFMYAREKYDTIDKEISLSGYFVIITSDKMTAEQALDLYKSRDASEKLFRGDKSYLGNRSFRVQSSESLHAKIFIEFVALIIRNRMHMRLKNQLQQGETRHNYMNVPAAIRELEKIEMVRRADHTYGLDHAVTATQKCILKAFHMTEKSIRNASLEISDKLVAMNHKEAK